MMKLLSYLAGLLTGLAFSILPPAVENRYRRRHAIASTRLNDEVDYDGFANTKEETR